MDNMNLNPGGIVGGLVCGGIVAAVIFPNVDPKNASTGVYKLPILGVIAGAFIGNFLWGAIFRKRS